MSICSTADTVCEAGRIIPWQKQARSDGTSRLQRNLLWTCTWRNLPEEQMRTCEAHRRSWISIPCPDSNPADRIWMKRILRDHPWTPRRLWQLPDMNDRAPAIRLQWACPSRPGQLCQVCWNRIRLSSLRLCAPGAWQSDYCPASCL